MKFCAVLLALFCIVSVCNVCFGGRYHYSVGITNAMPDAQLFLTPFMLYSSSPQLGVPSNKSIEGTKTVDSFTHRPLPLVRLHWVVRRGESVNRYCKDVEIDVPKQFTDKSGRGIIFVFYETQVLVVYGCSSGYSKNNRESIGKFDWGANYIFSDGTPYTLQDFQEFIKQNPGGSFDDFRRSQKRKYKK